LARVQGRGVDMDIDFLALDMAIFHGWRCYKLYCNRYYYVQVIQHSPWRNQNLRLDIWGHVSGIGIGMVGSSTWPLDVAPVAPRIGHFCWSGRVRRTWT
jgi:hypothetical protein